MNAQTDHHQTVRPKSGTPPPWTISMIGTILFIESILLFLVGLFQILTGSARVFLSPTLLWVLDHFSINHHPVLGTCFILLSLWALVIAMLFFRVSPSAWLPALGLQGTVLAISIARYHIDKPMYGYILMVCSLWLVVYLHYSEVEITFRVPFSTSEKSKT